MCITVGVQLNMYVQCAHHICSVIHIKYVYSAHCHLVECSDFIRDTNMNIHLPYTSIKYLMYMPNLVGIFVSRTYLAITSEVCIAVGCVLAHVCKNDILVV